MKDRYMLWAKEAPAGIIRWSKSWIAATWLVCCLLSPRNEDVRVGGESGERGRACLSCLWWWWWWCEPDAEAAFAVDVDEEARVVDELAEEPAMADMDKDICVGTLPEEAALVLAREIGRLDAAEVDGAVGVEDEEAEAYDEDEYALAFAAVVELAPGVEVEVEVELVEADIGWPPEGTPVVL